MGASDAQWLLEALNDVVVGLDSYLTAGRTLFRPNIGTLHYLPMPVGQRSMWGVVERYPDRQEPFYAVFEVDGDSEPSLPQEAHYTAVRRLEAHYLGSSGKVLLGMAGELPDGIQAPAGPIEVEDFRTISLRIPPKPFGGDAWYIRYRHRSIPECIFEIEHRFVDVVDASIFVEPTTSTGFPKVGGASVVGNL